MIHGGAKRIPSHDVKRRELYTLTSLRFFAALMVFLWHAHGWVFSSTNFPQVGYMGVGFFYILSGFILTYVYSAKLETGDMTSVKKFYISRVAKLWPVHILTFIASLPLVLIAVETVFPVHTKLHLAFAAFTNLTLLQSWVPDNRYNFSFNGVAWSISVELFFYALFPLLIYAVGKFRKMLSIQRLVTAMLCLWLAVLILYLPFGSVVDDWKLYIFPIARLPDFIMGILLGLLFIRLPKENRNVKMLVARVGSTKYEIVVLCSVAVAAVLSLWMPQSLRFAVWMMPVWMVVIFVFSQQGGVVSRFLMHRPLVFLGEASFSFYMIHQLVIRYIFLLNLSGVAAIVLSLIIAVALSCLSYVFYEEKLRVIVKNFLESRFTNKKRSWLKRI